MKRLALILPFFLIAAFLFAKPAKSQENQFDFLRAYQDYTYNYGVYRRTHNDYVLAKGQYLSYKTLKSKTNAYDKTLAMLQARDEVIKTYLTALRLKLVETEGVPSLERDALFGRIDTEVAWYEDHRGRLASAGSLEDLVINSEEVEDRYALSEILYYQTLISILAGKENDFRERLMAVISDVKDKVAEIRQNQDKNTRKIERWILEAELRLTRSQEKTFEAQGVISDLKERDRDKYKIYNESQEFITESHQYLKEANSFLKEIIDEAKTSDTQ